MVRTEWGFVVHRVHLIISLSMSLLFAQVVPNWAEAQVNPAESESHCEGNLTDSGSGLEDVIRISEGAGSCDVHDCDSGHSCCLQSLIALVQEHTSIITNDSILLGFITIDRWQAGYIQNPSPPPKSDQFFS